MPSRITSDIFKTANSFVDDESRIEYLRQSATMAVKEMININFNPNIVFLLPEGSPDLSFDDNTEFKPRNNYFPNNSSGDDGATLNYEIRKMYLFVEGSSPNNLNQLKRETLWIQLLNSLGSDEAEDISLCKDKKLQEKYKKLTHELCHKTFPEFVTQPQEKLKRDTKGRFSKKKKEVE
jgi:Txe/YoeB family toxin of Txe-Axe toxin-antitoxin module